MIDKEKIDSLVKFIKNFNFSPLEDMINWREMRKEWEKTKNDR